MGWLVVFFLSIRLYVVRWAVVTIRAVSKRRSIRQHLSIYLIVSFNFVEPTDNKCIRSAMKSIQMSSYCQYSEQQYSGIT